MRPVDGAASMTNPRLLMALGLGWMIATAFYFAFQGLGPFSDEGSFCTIAQGILHGRLPYRDYFNEKPPLQYFWTALVMRFAGDGVEGARAASTITLALTLGLLLSRLAKQPVSLGLMLPWAGTIAVIGLMMKVYNNTAESTLALLFVACAVMIFGRQWMRPGPQALLVGSIQGLACGFRQTMVVSAFILLISPWHRAKRWWYFAGFLLGMALWVAMLWSMGILQDALGATVFFHLDNPSGSSYFRLIDENDYAALLIWLLSLGSVFIAPSRSREAVWVVAWAIAAAAPFFGRMDAFRLWPSMSLILSYLFIRLSGTASFMGLVSFSVVVALGSATLHRPDSFWWTTQITERIGKYVAENETIWIGPFEPNAYCLSKRPSATKYYFILPWMVKPEVREELVKEITVNRPKLIVDLSNPTYSLKELVPDLDRLIQEKYALVEHHDGAGYFILRDAPRRKSTNLPLNP